MEGFPDSSLGKESSCSAGDPGLIPGLERSAGEGIGYPHQYAWEALVAQLVRICPQCGRAGFNLWVGKIFWRRERLPIPVLRFREFRGLHSLWCHKELDTTERLSLCFTSEMDGDLVDKCPSAFAFQLE